MSKGGASLGQGEERQAQLFLPSPYHIPLENPRNTKALNPNLAFWDDADFN